MVLDLRRARDSTLALLVCASCIAPPALIAPHKLDRDRFLASYPPGTERVEIEVEPDVRLRGVFVPSQPHAPVVLHLLESSGSVAAPKLHFGIVTRQLADLGYASLVVDYTGIGLSDGSTSVDHLERDALAMWREAERRADGAPVWIRATSLGAIPTAQLLAHGERPAGIVLVVPVFADTAVRRFARDFHGAVAGYFAALAFRDIAPVDVAAELQRSKVPTLVVTSVEDSLLSDDDRSRLSTALYETGRVTYRDGTHLQVGLEAHALFPEELRQLEPCCTPDVARERADAVLGVLDEAAREKHFAPGSPVLSRLEAVCARHRHGNPLATAAAALGISRANVAVRLLWLDARRSYPPLSFDDWRAVISLDDPAGELPIDLIEMASRPRDLVLDYGGALRVLDAHDIACASQQRGARAFDVDWKTTVTFSGGQSVRVELDGDRIFQALLDRGIAPADAERQFARILLKAHRIPDRLRARADGSVAVEVWHDGVWRVLAPDPERKGEHSFRMQLHGEL